MIINTGMRTDIPAFYPEWLANRLSEGYVLVRNPYCPEKITRYSLSPDVVDLIAFCTKNPAPMLPFMDCLADYGQYWFVTITPYGNEVEPNTPPKEKVLSDFRRLSEIVGINSVGWRYDPIFIDENYTAERHIAEFEKMASFLAGYTKTCVISFIDLYGKVRRNFPRVREVCAADRLILGKELIRIARKYEMTLKTCAEGRELEKYGAVCDSCFTPRVYEKALGTRLSPPKTVSPRKECGCLMGNDIGAYDTCGHLCRYCYANSRKEAVMRNMKAHDPFSPLLIGRPCENDIIYDAKQSSWTDDRISFF